MSEPDLDEAQNERLRAAVRQIGKTYTTSKALAWMLGIKPASLSTFLSRKNGASMKTAERAAEMLKKDVYEVIGKRGQPLPTPDDEPELAAAKADAKASAVSPEAIDRVVRYFTDGKLPIKPRAWWKHLFVEEQLAINRAIAEEQVARRAAEVAKRQRAPKSVRGKKVANE